MGYSEYHPKSKQGFACKSIAVVRRFIVGLSCRPDFFLIFAIAPQRIRGHKPKPGSERAASGTRAFMIDLGGERLAQRGVTSVAQKLALGAISSGRPWGALSLKLANCTRAARQIAFGSSERIADRPGAFRVKPGLRTDAVALC
jgi:hypothetical protein